MEIKSEDFWPEPENPYNWIYVVLLIILIIAMAYIGWKLSAFGVTSWSQ